MRRLCPLLALAMAVTGCEVGAGASVVYLDLCPAIGLLDAELTAVRSANRYRVTVWAMNGEEVEWSASRLIDQSESGLSTEGLIPQQESIRLLIEGFVRGATPEAPDDLVLLGASETVSMGAGERACVCTSPPERYPFVCEGLSCIVDGAECNFYR